MKLITYILLFTSLNAFSNDADSLFTVGNYHYENEAYLKAIESYLAIESDEHANAVYHNLGNCYYQTGNINKSILFYERALLLKKDSQTRCRKPMVRAPGLEPGFKRWQRSVITTTLRSQG